VCLPSVYWRWERTGNEASLTPVLTSSTHIIKMVRSLGRIPDCKCTSILFHDPRSMYLHQASYHMCVYCLAMSLQVHCEFQWSQDVMSTALLLDSTHNCSSCIPRLSPHMTMTNHLSSSCRRRGRAWERGYSCSSSTSPEAPHTGTQTLSFGHT